MSKYFLSLLFCSVWAMASHAAEAPAQVSCPEFLNHEYRQLHSQHRVNLCDKYQGKPMLLVNTASYCGFTHQFAGLESLYQKYQSQGIEVIGFASHDFNQEDRDESKTAGVCFKNYGVTFTMIAPTPVKGPQANPTFRYLGQQSQAPGWNFNKYLLSGDGTQVQHFDSRTAPLDSVLEQQLRAALKGQTLATAVNQ